MKKTQKKDLKVLDKIKQKAVKGGTGRRGIGCPPPDPDED